MTLDTTDSDRRLTRNQRAIVSLVAVVCILFAGATLVTAQQQTFSDDFENGNAEGWVHQEDGHTADVSSTSVEGEYSLHAHTNDMVDGTPRPVYDWTDGPFLDMGESFDVSGTVQPDFGAVQNPQTIRIGITGDDQSEAGENAYLIFNEPEGDETYLGTWHNQEPEGDTVDSSFDKEWANFRISSVEGENTLRAKVWPHGTSEPSDWQLTRDGFDGIAGYMSVNVGHQNESEGGADREVYLDSVSVEGEIATSEDLRLDAPGYLPHNESSSYAVEYNQSGTWTDVTGEATVTPENTDALTFYPDNQTVVAGGNKSINERVNVTATYQGLQQTGTIVVATPTVDNLDLLPAWWSVNAVLSDWTMIWILMATLIATAATRMATTFAGIGAFAMAMIMGWIMGDVPDGIMVATIFMALFIGLNLAANIDYSVR